ncbi:MAG: hypothetical protein LBD09_04885 [Treponema sp.]|jgi:hypothetical protein|nr:hypothetical protein [Treponema sp.]
MACVCFRKPGLGLALLAFRLAGVSVLAAQPLAAPEVLRGEVKIELEQARGFTVEETRTLPPAEARQAALDEAARYFGAMIYGWSFRYVAGERARDLAETLELSPLGTVDPADPRLEATDWQWKDFNLYLWADYRPAGAQRFRMAKWKAGSARSVQGYGQSPLEDKHKALEDAARGAIRAMLRGNERNRPREVTGYISLAAFPRYWLDRGQWMTQGRFYVEILEIRPFAAY